MDKNTIRADLLDRRSKMNDADVAERSAEITGHLITSGILKSAQTVMSYLSFGNEVTTDEIHAYLFRQGKTVSVPYTDENCQIHPCVLEEDIELIPGKFSVLMPKELHFLEKEPDVILLPCVGVDRKGNRIGFGKGCYDRFLEGKKAVKVALAYQFQVMDAFSPGEYDVPVDFVVTEEGIWNTKGNV